jgi:ATP-dependent helicase/nuclease subunit A
MIEQTNLTGALLKPVKPADSTWTDEQWDAISLQGNNMLVAAAAGSGKTAVLVERIIRRISDEAAPVDVDRLLVATFTKAAAAEMKERIREALQHKLESDPESAHLRKQLALMGRASVTTLHSFCMEIIQRYYSLIGLDPGFRIANETENELLKQETLEAMLEECYEKNEEDSTFWQLVESFGNNRGDGPLIAIILQLYELSRSQPWPSHWLLETASKFSIEMNLMSEEQPLRFWQENLIASIKLELQGAADLLIQAIRIADLPSGPSPYLETFREELQEVQDLIKCADHSWTELHDGIISIPSRRLKPCRGDSFDSNLKDQASLLRKKSKEIVEKLRVELFGRTEAEFMEEIHKLEPMMHLLVKLVIQFAERFTEAKASKGLLDFGDLEHYALAILRHSDSTPVQVIPSQAAMDYQEHFVEVLVDEYQDTNQVQEAILQLISSTSLGNRFMVGDVKQSIYKFRLADPGLFMDKYKDYSSQDVASGMKIDLARNFRSRQEVVHAVNYIFRQILNERVGELDYNADAELIFGSKYYPDSGQDYAAEVILIDRSGNELEQVENHGDEDAADQVISEEALNGDADELTEDGLLAEMEELKAAQAEARAIGRQIAELMGRNGQPPFNVFDKRSGGSRPVEYRDIVILLRATSSWAPTFVEELQRQGIPAYADLSTGYFSATEVNMIMSLLKVIDNPFQDVPLAAVLRSPIVGLSAGELAQIRIFGGVKGSYFDSLRKTLEAEQEPLLAGTEQNSSSLITKVSKFLADLHEWRTEARQGSLAELIWSIYRSTGIYDYVGGLPQGEQRQANLRALYDRARQYESTSLRGLFRFLRFIERMQQSGGDLGTARSLGEGEDTVRLMSIHKSKGLEFPVVFVAGMGKGFNQTDVRGSFLVHKDMGFGPRFVDSELSAAYPTLPQLAIRWQMKQEALAEELRILYVALTRAREKLYLVGAVKDANKLITGWGRMSEHQAWNLPDYELIRAANYLDWLGPALIRHRLAEEWRNIAGVSSNAAYEQVSLDASKWGFKIMAISSLQDQSELEQEAVLEEERLQVIREGRQIELQDEGRYQSLIQTLEWQYPYSDASKISSKTSVSEMKRLADRQKLLLEQDELRLEQAVVKSSALLRRPRFMEEKKLTPAERGTLYHAVMQNIPLGEVPSKETIAATINHMIGRELMTSSQSDAIDPAVIHSFFDTELGRRMAVAPKVQREVPFSYGLRTGDLHDEIDTVTANDKVLIQGVIDCLFEDEQGLVLVDYKTDRVYGLTTEQLKERYMTQISLYAKAVSHIYRKPINEQYVFYFDNALLIRMDD